MDFGFLLSCPNTSFNEIHYFCEFVSDLFVNSENNSVMVDFNSAYIKWVENSSICTDNEFTLIFIRTKSYALPAQSTIFICQTNKIQSKFNMFEHYWKVAELCL